jgi:hypothetical protein
MRYLQTAVEHNVTLLRLQMKKLNLVLLFILASCSESHPAGMDATLRSALDAIKQSDCNKFLTLLNPLEDDSMSAEQCTEWMRSDKRDPALRVIEYVIGAKGKLDATKTIYSFDLKNVGSKQTSFELIKIGDTWYLKY